MTDFSSQIVGAKFYAGAMSLLSHTDEKSVVTLRREPDNAYDPNAIAVYLEVDDSTMKVGHIPKTDAAFLSAIMDQGTEITAAFNPCSPTLRLSWDAPNAD